MIRPIRNLGRSALVAALAATLLAPAGAGAHAGGVAGELRARIASVTPAETTVHPRIDELTLVLTNRGSRQLRVCRPDAAGCDDPVVLDPGDATRVDIEDLAPGDVDIHELELDEAVTGTVEVRGEAEPATVSIRVERVDTRGWIERYGEYGLLVLAVVSMLVWFAIDARRRRRSRGRADG